MGTPKPPVKALLFVSTLYRDDEYFDSALEAMEARFGESVMQSAPIAWNYSEFYKNEIGPDLIRKIVFFRNPIEKDTLPALKLTANDIEREFSAGPNRKINLDPGYLTLAKVVLATTKNYSHRIYLRDGIFADMMLSFRQGAFRPHSNTYRDYCDETHIRFFTIARKLYNLLINRI